VRRVRVIVKIPSLRSSRVWDEFGEVWKVWKFEMSSSVGRETNH